MTQEIHYAFDAILESDERMQDAVLYHYLETCLETALIPCATATAPTGAWGRDWHGCLPERREMARAAYTSRPVRDALGATILNDSASIRAFAGNVSRTSGYGITLRNLRNPVEQMRHAMPGEDLRAHLAAIGAGHGDPVLVSPDFDLVHMRRFLVVDGRITSESPMAFSAELACIPGDDFIDFGVSPDGALEDGSPGMRLDQLRVAEALLAKFPLSCGAIDVGLEQHEIEPRARVGAVTAAPPGGVFPYMADLARHARAVADHAARRAPAQAAAPSPDQD